MKNLYIMVGPAGAGKSTWLKNHCNPNKDVVVSRDQIRFQLITDKKDYFSKENEVYSIWISNIQKAIDKNNEIENVYCDATNLTEKTRDRLLKKLDLTNVNEIYAVVVCPSLDETLRRNLNRVGLEYVPQSVIENMYKRYESPKNDVKFPKKIIVVEE